MARNAVFQQVRGNRPGRSLFDLSYDKKMTMDMGQLIPVLCEEMVPGDTFKIANQAVVRFQPLVAPILHEINAYTYYFFVPYRLLDDNWDDFITGGIDGDLTPEIPRFPADDSNTVIGTLWDYFGFPTGVVPTGALPLAYPWSAYNTVWNEYFRDETLQDEVGIYQPAVLNCCWEKDYFTSALPWQQRGTAPALPISGTTSAVFPASAVNGSTAGAALQINTATVQQTIFANNAQGASNLLNVLNGNTVDLSTASTFDIADLRLAFQIQRWLELNARAGARYTEFLRAHFGVAPRDDRLQRPEFIGATKAPVIISEVLQTSSTDTESPQGNLAGHGISVNSEFAGSYTAQEFGLVLGIFCVKPRSAYQQGIDRQWLRRTKYDFYFPEFANLSEQAIERAEIYASGVEAENKTIFGYQGRYDEMRVKRSMVCGQMRNTFAYWHLGRQFTSAPALNSTFVEMIPRKDVFAAPTEPGLIVNFANKITAIRPLPYQANPGLIDHVY